MQTASRSWELDYRILTSLHLTIRMKKPLIPSMPLSIILNYFLLYWLGCYTVFIIAARMCSLIIQVYLDRLSLCGQCWITQWSFFSRGFAFTFIILLFRSFGFQLSSILAESIKLLKTMNYFNLLHLSYPR